MNEQMMFSFAVERPLGYVEDGEKLKGKMIPFRDLKAYIGKRVLLEMPRQSAVDYKVIKITGYYQHDDFDRVGYTDNKKPEHAWASESYCKNGKGAGQRFPECMYELKEET